MPFNHMAAGERVVEPRLEAQPLRNRQSLRADRRVGGLSPAVSEHNRRHALRRWRHRMAVKQERAAEAVEQQSELCLDRLMIGSVRLVEPFVELLGRDSAAPEIAVLRGSARDDAQAASRPRADPVSTRSFNHRGVDFIFAPIAVDGRAGGPRNDCATTALESPPGEAIDEWVLKGRERRLAGCCKPYQPIGIIPAGMRHRQQYRQLTAWRMDGWRGELVHGCG